MTSTIVGWVLVDGHDADGTILEHGDFAVHTGGGMRATDTAEQVAAAVFRAQELAATLERRLHVIGVTWNDDAAAEAALLLESLTSAGFDNVVPVRSLQAAETLARGLVPVIGYDKTAVCVMDDDSTTVVMVDVSGGSTRTAVKQLRGGADRLTRWLTAMFDGSRWRPRGVVVVASDSELDLISSQLEKALPVPVFTQNAAHLARARGAALASAQSTEFTAAQVTAAPPDDPWQRPRSRPPSYAGALSALVVGAVTFVGSLSLAVGLQVIPNKEPRPAARVAHSSARPPVAQAPTPPPARAVTPVVEAPPTAAAQQSPEPAVPPPSAEPQSRPEPVPASPPADVPQPPVPPVAPPPEQPAPPPNPHPLLTRVLERIHGHRDPAPEEAAPAQAPPPPANATTPPP
ncbi:hypothetical protein MHEC_22500 [Mycobacterium heckeshornense]|uniref:DUF7159 domain-containing protein n=2 Tax=Mycobacterium heckeshornense TaxID=110505 RepID=A0A7R7GTS2_9MYCO|nr:hypothetical protein MHEC_22500 [Mycobacterium heckeshornense]